MSFIKTNADITKLDVEAIVIGANAKFRQGGGINKEIFRKAGADKLKQEIHGLIRYRHKFKAGDCIVTSGGDLTAKCIIHAVTPIWFCGIFRRKHKIILLDSCYNRAKCSPSLKRRGTLPATQAAGIPHLALVETSFEKRFNYGRKARFKVGGFFASRSGILRIS